MTAKAAKTTLAALLLAAAVLVGVELGKGAASYGSAQIENPCRFRTFEGSGLDATVQRVVLDGLDGAACRLGVSREVLVLSLAGGGGFPHTKLDRARIEKALRAAMLEAVDRAERRGDVPGFLVPLLRRAIESAPLDALIRGALSFG
jgi:hypothetical protein